MKHTSTFLTALLMLFLCSIVATAQEKQLVLLFTGATNGYLEECNCGGSQTLGGLARRNTIINETRRDYPDKVLLLDAGNVLSTYRKNESRDQFVVTLIKKMRYDAINLGEQEFIYGASFLAGAFSGERLISASAQNPSGSTLAPAYFIKSVDGISVAVIGAMTEGAYSNASSETKLGFKVRPLMETLEETMTAVKSQNPDMTVLLLRSQELGMEKKIAEKFPSVGLIITTSTEYEKMDLTKIGKTMCVSAGHDGEKIGRLWLKFDGATRAVTSASNELVRLSSSVPREEEIDLTIQNFKKGKGK
ncbi:MAG: hypothetical protein IAF08_08430 [Rhizobacter sp.]|nr:hypothetical protein [Chlorobiales bacterium]